MFDLKIFRKLNNVTQKDIAAYFGCDQPFISQIENGTRSIPTSYIRKILADGVYQYDDLQIENNLIVKPNEIIIDREVFEQISRLTETVLSQQKTIENLTKK